MSEKILLIEDIKQAVKPLAFFFAFAEELRMAIQKEI